MCCRQRDWRCPQSHGRGQQRTEREGGGGGDATSFGLHLHNVIETSIIAEMVEIRPISFAEYPADTRGPSASFLTHAQFQPIRNCARIVRPDSDVRDCSKTLCCHIEPISSSCCPSHHPLQFIATEIRRYIQLLILHFRDAGGMDGRRLGALRHGRAVAMPGVAGACIFARLRRSHGCFRRLRRRGPAGVPRRRTTGSGSRCACSSAISLANRGEATGRLLKAFAGRSLDGWFPARAGDIQRMGKMRAAGWQVGPEAGGDDGDLNFIAQRLIEDGAENNVRVFVSGTLNDGGGLIDLTQFQGTGAADVDEDAAGAIDGSFFQKWRRHGSIEPLPWRDRDRCASPFP